MEKKPYLIGYDLKFLQSIGSLECAVVFFNINSMINRNLAETESAPRYKYYCHLGNNGVCVTYKEMADFICMKERTMKDCMRILQSHNIVFRDSVILEMIKASFLCIGKNGSLFCNPEQEDLRFFHASIAKKTQCFNCAAVHGHVYYWNDKTKAPWIQSMAEIAEATGLTYRQVQLSIKKLRDLGLLSTGIHKDSRYALVALLGDGTESVEGTKNVGGLDGNWVTPSTKTVDILLDSYGLYDRRGGEEERTPTLFSRIDSEHEKEQDIRKTYKNIHFELQNVQYQELEKNYKPDEIRIAVNRYNQEWIKRDGPPKNQPFVEILRLLKWQIEDAAKEVKVKEDQMKEEENKPLPEPSEYIKIIVEKHGSVEAFKAQQREKREEEERQLKAKNDAVEPKKVNIEDLKAQEERRRAIKESDEKRTRERYAGWSEEDLGGLKIE